MVPDMRPTTRASLRNRSGQADQDSGANSPSPRPISRGALRPLFTDAVAVSRLALLDVYPQEARPPPTKHVAYDCVPCFVRGYRLRRGGSASATRSASASSAVSFSFDIILTRFGGASVVQTSRLAGAAHTTGRLEPRARADEGRAWVQARLFVG